MKLSFCPADASDVETLFRLSRELIDRYEDTASVDYEKVLDWVRRKIETNVGEYRRICCDGQTAGYYRFHPENGKMELDDLSVFPPFQNRGIGTAVLRRCIAAAEEPIFLYVFSRNTGADALYRRMGFRVVGTAGKTRRVMQLG